MSLDDFIIKIKHKGFRSFVKKAVDLGVDIKIYPNKKSLVRFSFNNKFFYSNKCFVPLNLNSGDLAKDKEITKIVLEENNINVPKGLNLNINQNYVDLVENNLNFPLVVKPNSGSLAVGLTRNVNSKKGLVKAVKKCEEERKILNFNDETFIVEEMFLGREFRVIVLNNKVVSCVEKIPPTIIGDGSSTVKELIKTFNKNRQSGFKVRIDAEVLDQLSYRGLSLDSIISNNKEIILKKNVMMRDGARCIDRTNIMSVYLKDTCVKAVKCLGLNFAGIDLISKDIKQSDNYVILEVNSKPVYIINEKPLVEGEGVDISELLLFHMFPELKGE